MKAIVKALSILFLIGGILFLYVGGMIEDNSYRPTATTGYVNSAGDFVPVKTVGGGVDTEKANEASATKGIGYMLIVASIGGFIGSFFIKDNQGPNY